MKDRQTGNCYGSLVIGLLWKVFLYSKPRAGCGEPDGASDIEHYMDIGNKQEAWLINSILRDLRASVG
jgi:hypothetical protein